MPDPTRASAGSEPPPPPPPPNVVTYTNPRRASPETSVTLRHHRLAREASKRHASMHVPSAQETVNLPRRNSSEESNETGVSDARKWFDSSNQNSKGNLDTSTMDVDPPFYQKKTDSSNEEPVPSQSPAYRFVQDQTPALRPNFTQSSSADDYRSVIDDLTVENKRLKDELRRYKQMGPGSLRRDKLFEVKVHGLPSRKKRELEAALRDFTTSLEGSSAGGSPSRRKGHGKSKNISFLGEGASKHASSSSGSNPRPVDSAYASMSGAGTTSATGTGTSSCGRTHPASGKAAKQRSNLKIQNYLRDIPEGLFPRPTFMTEKDRKKLVVKRLEQLFTGRMAGYQKEYSRMPVPIPEDDAETEANTTKSNEKNLEPIPESLREAKIRPRDGRQTGGRSRDNGSASNEHSNGDGDQADSRDASGSGSGHDGNTGSNPSPEGPSTPKQRPTRPRDLDPDRQQNPAENIDYIRHLGIVAPESQKEFSARDVSPDAEGWVYLNLLCNLAQLHMFNVTPDFIRSAVMEKSTKFQLSPNGRKIRWRGGEEGTRFSSDNSGQDSQRSQSSSDTDGSNDRDQRKKQKTQQAPNDVMSRSHSNFKPQTQARQDSNSSASFHYKPLFVRHGTSSSEEQPSAEDETGSSYGGEESAPGHTSRWGQSGVSGFSQRKRRRDGAIIYYSGAPFCTDLSGDWGEMSPDTGYDMTSSGDQGPLSLDINRPELYRSSSGSTLPYRPLSGPSSQSHGVAMDVDDSSEPPELTSGETDVDEIEANFEWSNARQHAPLINLDASGLAGTYPDDHFVVVATTKRPKAPQVSHLDGEEPVASKGSRVFQRLRQRTANAGQSADSIATQLADMSTTSPRPFYSRSASSRSSVDIEYVGCQFRRLPPVPLPPPAFFYDDSASDIDAESSDGSGGIISHRAMLEEDTSPEEDLSGNDEEDEDSDADADADFDDEGIDTSPDSLRNMGSPLAPAGRGEPMSGRSVKTSSSLATAGGAQSGGSSLEFP